MRRLLLFTFLVCSIVFPGILSAQQLVPYYTFSQNSGTYSAISGGTVLASGTGLDDQRYLVSLPFTFNMNGTNYTQAYISVNGYLSFDTDPGNNQYWIIQSTSTGYAAAAGFAANLASLNSTTELQYITSGIAPNRTFTVQWKNFGYPSSSALTANFQIQLNETTNTIVTSYGTTTLTGSTSQISVQVGLRGTSNATFFCREGNWGTTTAGTTNNDNIITTPTNLPASGLTNIFTPPACTTPANQPTSLVLNPGTASVSVSYTAASPAVDKYLVVRTPNVPLNTTPVNGTAYISGNTLGNGTVVYAGTGTSFSSTGLTQSTYYTYTVFAYDELCVGGPAYKTTTPLTGTVRTNGPDRYTWIATSGTGSWTTATNWSPTRTNPFSADTLVFGNGGNPVVTGVPSQTVSTIEIKNNTAVQWQSSSSSNNLTISGGTFLIEAGSAVTLLGGIQMKYGSAAPIESATINGTLTIGNSSSYDAYYSLTIVKGIVNDTGSNADFKNSCTGTCTTDIVFDNNSYYNHARNGGVIPPALYHAGSTVNITGIINTAPTNVSGEVFGNYIWDCPLQASSVTVSTAIDTIKGNLTISSTGTYALKITMTGSEMDILGDFTQLGGTFQLSSNNKLRIFGNTYLINGVLDVMSNTSSGTTLRINKDLLQGSGHVVNKSSTGNAGITFEGNTKQNVVISGVFMPMTMTYILDNIAGGTLTGNLPAQNGSMTIKNGAWGGTGSFMYTTGALIYNHPLSQSTSSVEWPSVNGPASVTLNLTGSEPNNRLALHESRSVTTFDIPKGVLVLGASNLTVNSIPTSFYVNDDLSVKMVAADSTGQLFRIIAPTTNTQVYPFPVGSIKDSARFAIAYFVVGSNSSQRTVGFRAVDQKHPNESSGTDYMDIYWSITDDGGSAPMQCYVNLNFPLSHVVGSTNKILHRWNGSNWIDAKGFLGGNPLYDFYTLSSINDTIKVPTPLLNGSSFTGRAITGSTVYSWTAAIDKDYQNPGNWSPNRNNRSFTDMLQFNGGNTDTVKNVLPERVTRLNFTNNTTVIWQMAANPTPSQKYIIQGDFNVNTNDLNIDSGSTLYVYSPLYPFWISYNDMDTSIRGRIAGRLEFNNTSSTESKFESWYGITTVTPSGVIAGGSTYWGGVFAGTSPSTLVINGTYENKYTTTQGEYPNATWGIGSTVKIIGYTTSTAGGIPIDNPFYNLIYDCPNQISIVNSNGNIPPVLNNMQVVSTGTGKWHWNSSSAFKSTYVHNYIQTGGIVDLSTNASTIANNFSGNFSQTGGTIHGSITSNIVPAIVFNGTNGRQNVSFHNAAPANIATYQISNPDGINLNGTGSLTNNFDLSTLRISTAALFPITTNLKLNYTNVAALFYDVQDNATADSVIFPVINGPKILSVAIGTSNKLKLPFSRTISQQLVMTSGNIDVGGDTLTLGVGPTSAGILSHSAGSIILTNNGAFKRWFGTGPMPTTPNDDDGYFPISNNGSNRSVSLYFSTSTALSSSGTVTISHNDAPGITTGLSVTDGALTLGSRTNASWLILPGDGITLASSSIGLKITGADLFTTTTTANLRLMKANSVVGTVVNGGGTLPDFYVQRTGLSLTDLSSGAFYIGAEGANLGNIFISVTDGNWKNGSTWNQGIAPTAGSFVLVRSGDTVTVDTTTQVVKMLTVNKNGGIFVNDSTLFADSSILNYGLVNLTKGKIILGPAGGGKSPFNNYGTLAVNSGNLNINGSLRTYAASKLKQAGGDITIDGNANGVAANSVPANVHICRIETDSVIATAGNITIVDPHVSTTWGAFYTNSSNAVFGKNHNLIFGDGISTTAGSANAFVFSPSSAQLGNVIVKGSPSGANRMVNVSSATALNNLILQNNNAEYDMQGYNLKVAGDITVGTGAILKATYTIEFASDQPQTVSGAGLTGQSFYGLHLNNSSANGVTFTIGDFSYTNTLAFTKGKLNIGSATITKTGTHYTVNTAGSSTGWVVGKYSQRAYAETLLFPVGDANTYAPVTVIIPTSGVSGTGYIRAGTIAGDHANILTSNINYLKSVNRQYTIDTIGNVNLIGNPVSIIFNWNAADVDPGAITTGFFAQSYKNNIWSSHTTALAMATTLTINGIGNNIPSTYQVGQPGNAPLISQQPVSQSICSSTNTAFSVGVTLTGSYKWQVNTGSSWADIQPGLPYSGITTATLSIINAPLSINGYQYRCKAYNATDSITSNAATLNVGLTAAPTITISANTGNTICANTSVTFTASIVNGGVTPSFQWYKNGISIGSNSNTYISSSLADQDSITCVLTSSSSCANPATATSNYIKMTVNPTAAPSVSVTANPGNTICTGTSVTFTAAATNAGTTPTYQWKKNNINVGANSTSYTDNALVNGDQVSCVVTSSHNCATPSTATNSITMSVNPILTPSVSINSGSGTTICSGTSVTFTATPTNGGTTPPYQWKVNNINAGTNSNIFNTTTLVNSDVVTCVMTSTETCVTSTTATSTGITMTVNPLLTPTVSIAANPGNTICAGTSVTFTATPVNGGTTPSYQWKVNSTNVGTNSTTYSSTTLSNSDVVTCVLTSNATCATPATATSSGITMTVNPMLTPSVSIAANPGSTICAGTSVTFTATPTNGGTTPSYQWKVNNVNTGTNSTTYTSSTLSNNDVVTCVLTSNANCLTATTATSTAITMTVNPVLTPAVSISSAQGTTICAGTSVVFTASPTSGGTTPAYQWKVNSVNAGTNSSTFTTSTLNNNDVVVCELTSNATCANPLQVTSSGITMTVNPVLTPTVSITANPSTPVCAGTSVTFTAATTNSGTTPSYQWKVNGVNAGTNSPTFTSSTLTNNDVVTCELTSTATCANPTSVTSSGITMTVNPLLTPSIAINAAPGNIICNGEMVTFTATPTNGGASPSYQWKVNGINAGSNSNTFVTTSLANSNVITCQLTSNAICLATPSATSTGITMTVNPQLVPTVSITASPGVNVGPYASVTFTASITNGGNTPSFQWKKNGANIPGATATTYTGVTSKDFVSNDKITVAITSNATCVKPKDTVSNELAITINLGIVPSGDDQAITLVPNPNNGNFRINGKLNYNSNRGKIIIDVLNILGQSVNSINMPQSQDEFNVEIQMPENAQNGLYLLRVKDGDNALISRFILQR